MRDIDVERVEGAHAVPLPPGSRAFSIGSPSGSPAEVRGFDPYGDEVRSVSGSPGVRFGISIEEEYGRPARSVTEYHVTIPDPA